MSLTNRLLTFTQPRNLRSTRRRQLTSPQHIRQQYTKRQLTNPPLKVVAHRPKRMLQSRRTRREDRVRVMENRQQASNKWED
jgi:hypothetical protein